MKKLLFFLAFVGLMGVANGQHYYTLPDSNVVWIVQQDNGFGGWNYYKFLTSINKDDTLINSKYYIKLFYQYYQFFYYQGAYRSDTNGKTFFVPADSLNEYLIYDFSKNQGDTLKNVLYNIPPYIPPPSNYLFDFVVDSINYVTAGPYHLKRMYLRNNTLLCRPLVSIEKIGNGGSGFFNYSIYCGLGYTLLSCMSFNDTIYFNAPFSLMNNIFTPTYIYGQCDLPNGIDNINQNSILISFFPNPTVDNLTIETPPHSTIEISNIEGQLIKTLTASGTKTNVDVSALPCGVYVVQVKTEKGVGVRKFIKE